MSSVDCNQRYRSSSHGLEYENRDICSVYVHTIEFDSGSGGQLQEAATASRSQKSPEKILGISGDLVTFSQTVPSENIFGHMLGLAGILGIS